MIKLPKISNWPEWAMAIVVATSMSFVVLALVTWLAFDPERDMRRAMTRLADDYYTDYLYPSMIGGAEEPSQALAIYRDAGLPTVRLRQLLLYDEASRGKFEKYFDNEHLTCDTNTTTLRFFPEEPYGAKDYRVEYYYNCDIMDEI